MPLSAQRRPCPQPFLNPSPIKHYYELIDCHKHKGEALPAQQLKFQGLELIWDTSHAGAAD